MTTTTATDLVLAERRGAVLVLTLNRPERLNAWTDALEERYYERLDEAEDDPEVRAIVVTGAGRGFCAGADMDDLERGRHRRRRRGRIAARPAATADLPADRAQAADRGDQRRGRGPRPGRGALLRHPLRDAGGEAHDGVRAPRPRRRVRHRRGCCRGWSATAARWTCCCPGRVVARRGGAAACGWSTASASPSALVDDAVAYAADLADELLAVVDGHDQGPGPGRPRPQLRRRPSRPPTS